MRRTRDEIFSDFEKVRVSVKIGGYYAHYKHPGQKRYRVVAIGLMEDTWVPMVTYEHLDTGAMCVRTLENFLEKVEIDGKMVSRFSLVN